MAQLKRDRETMKSLGNVKKAEFIWDYYKVPIAIAAVVVFILASLVSAAVTRGGNVLYVVMVNTGESPKEDDPAKDVFEKILTDAGVNMNGKKVSVENNYSLSFEDATDSDIATLQVLSALFGIGDLDLFVSDKEVYDKFAIKNGFSDLRAFIEQDVLAANQDKIYYFENEKGETVPVGIRVPADSVLTKEGICGPDMLVGIVSRAENADNAAKVLNSLLIVQN